MLNSFYFKFFALSQKINGVGRHNHYYACLSLSFLEIALFINGVLLAHMFLGVGELLSSVTKFSAVLMSVVVFLVNYIFFSIRSCSKDFLAKKKVALCKSSGHIGGVLSLLIPIVSMFSLAYFLIERWATAQKGNKDDFDLKFTYGLQAGAKVGLTKLLGAKIDLDVASKEISLITGKEYANQRVDISVDISGFSLGLDASRNQEFSTFVYGKDSVMSILSGKPFEFKPVFSTPWNVSSKEFWKLEFGASAVLGLEGTLDFE